MSGILAWIKARPWLAAIGAGVLALLVVVRRGAASAPPIVVSPAEQAPTGPIDPGFGAILGSLAGAGLYPGNIQVGEGGVSVGDIQPIPGEPGQGGGSTPGEFIGGPIYRPPVEPGNGHQPPPGFGTGPDPGGGVARDPEQAPPATPAARQWLNPNGRLDLGVGFRWLSAELGSGPDAWPDYYRLLGNVNSAPPNRYEAVKRLAGRHNLHPALAAALQDVGAFDQLAQRVDPRSQSKWIESTADVWGKRKDVQRVPGQGWLDSARLLTLATELSREGQGGSIQAALERAGLSADAARRAVDRYYVYRHS